MRKTLVALIVTATCLAGPATAAAQPAFFLAKLHGINEVPPVESGGAGNALVALDPDSGLLAIAGGFAGLTGPPLAVQIHFGEPGKNGPVMFWVNTSKAEEADGYFETVLMPENFAPSPEVPSYKDAVTALLLGYAYVNVLSSASPAGEIRGQLMLYKTPAK